MARFETMHDIPTTRCYRCGRADSTRLADNTSQTLFHIRSHSLRFEPASVSIIVSAWVRTAHAFAD
jgi:hypothetical protein